MSESAATLRRISVLASVAGAFVLAGTAGAQNAPQAAAASEPPQDKELIEVVVTGSRVRRDEFTSASPVQIITRDQSVLAGLASTTEILQGSTATGGGQQINNYFGGFVTEGGPGANTISLRGLGAVRTLVLLNGRRIAPAGTRGQVGSADLNVLPSAMVERVEILKDGASSIYGSDAVAGVVNIITRRGIDEWTVEATGLNTYDGGGDQTVASLVGGQTSDRFEINGSLEFYERTNLEVGQRDWASCSTELLRDPVTGQRFDQIDPLTGKPKCFPISGLAGTNGTAHNYIVSSVPMAGARWEPDPGATSSVIPGWKNVDVAANRAPFPEMLLKESLISPAKTYTGFLNATYDLHALGDAELYFEALGTRRTSEQIGSRQLSVDYYRGHPFVPEPFRSSGGGLGLNPFGQTIAARALVAWGNDETSQAVNFWRGVAGLRGDLPFGNWKYDGYVVYNKASASYTFQSFLTDRVYNSIDVVVAPTGTTAPTRSVNGVNYTCRVNTTNPSAGCVPVPAITGSFLRGVVDDAYRNYVFRPVTGHTSFDETTVSLTADGNIWPVPAGNIKGAVGLEYRKSRLNDTPSNDSINANLYNLTSGGITKGDDSVKELFAEVEVPILRGVQFAQDLTFNVSGRYTDYDSYGSDNTYKLGLGWTPVKWLKLRGTKGTSYRAPGIYEQFLAPTSGFLSSQNDPCNQYGNLPTTSARYRNCAAELPGQPNFQASSSVRVDAAGGRSTGLLKSETSDADTIGIVLQPDLGARIGDLSLAVDWWKIEVDGQIDRIGGAAILQRCYDDPQFRSGGGFCNLVAPRTSGGTLQVLDNFINIATQIAEGFDYTVRYNREIGTGELKVDLRATQYRVQDSKLFPEDPFDKNNGTLFSPEWVGDLDARYEWKEWTLRYGLTYVGAMDSYAFFEEDPKTSVFDLATGEYMTHNMSVKYKSKNKWEVLVGVRNLTDEEPKKFSAGVTSLRQGDALLYSGYDFFGRTAFLTVSKTF